MAFEARLLRLDKRLKFGIREKLATLKGEELTAFQERMKAPLTSVDGVFKTAESGKLDEMTQAMLAVSKEINEALKK